MINKPVATVQVIARAHMVHSAAARRAPSSNASNLGKIMSGTPVDHRLPGERWGPLAHPGLEQHRSVCAAGRRLRPYRDQYRRRRCAQVLYPGDPDIGSRRRGAERRGRLCQSLSGRCTCRRAQICACGSPEGRLIAHGAAGGRDAAPLHSAPGAIGGGQRKLCRKGPRGAGTPRFARTYLLAQSAPAPKKPPLQIIGGSGTRTSMTPSSPREVQIH